MIAVAPRAFCIVFVHSFRKPHLAFRFPQPFLQYLQKESEIAVAAHPVLNADVPPIAHCQNSPQSNPCVAMPNALVLTALR